MASGKLGSASLAANTLTSVYSGPATSYAVVDISFVNTTLYPITIQLAISTASSSASVTAKDYVVYNRTLSPYDEYERTGEPISTGEHIWAYASASGVSVRVKGFESAT